MNFSERHGYKPIKKIIQVDSMDTNLRNLIWSFFYETYINPSEDIEEQSYGKDVKITCEVIMNRVWIKFFHKKINEMKVFRRASFEKDCEYLFDKLKWYEVYDLMEFIIKEDDTRRGEVFKELLNSVLESENSAYRVVGNSIIRNIEDCEIDSVEQVFEQDRYEGVKIHIQTALDLLARKPEPDLRNSIKESISAVESMCCIICNDNKATLGKALDKIKKQDKYNIHKTLISGFDKIYGYTSNGDGIRHALEEQDNLYYEDALYMVVSCSAFINYLIQKYEKQKI